MGEYAEMMLDGTMCQYCGEYLGNDAGYPVACAGCGNNWNDEGAKIFMKEKDMDKAAQKLCDELIRKLGVVNFEFNLKHQFHKSVKGLLKGFYADDKGRMRNDGIEKTLANNEKAKAKKNKYSKYK